MTVCVIRYKLHYSTKNMRLAGLVVIIGVLSWANDIEEEQQYRKQELNGCLDFVMNTGLDGMSVGTDE